MIIRLSKKDLKAEAELLGAEKIARLNNIYEYENARDKLCEEVSGHYEGIAYCANSYKNTGRLDKIVQYIPETDSIKVIKYTYYTE